MMEYAYNSLWFLCGWSFSAGACAWLSRRGPAPIGMWWQSLVIGSFLLIFMAVT